MLTIGVDSARGGWIAVAFVDGRFEDAVLERRFPGVLDSFGEADMFGVDVPIGLPEPGARPRADVEARAVGRQPHGLRRASPAAST